MIQSNHLILCHPLLILPSIFPRIRIFSSELVLHIRWQRIKTSASTSVLPINIQSSFPLGLNGLLAVQETRKSLSQHHSQKASILQHSAFFIVQLSHAYMTTGETIAFTRRVFIGKVMSLLFNMLSRLVIAFLPRSKRLLISWLQSPSTVILEPKKVKSVTISIVSPSICHEVHLFLTVLEAGKSKINVPVSLVSGEGSSWLADGCLLAVSYTAERYRALVSSSSYKTASAIGLAENQCPTVMGVPPSPVFKELARCNQQLCS